MRNDTDETEASTSGSPSRSDAEKRAGPASSRAALPLIDAAEAYLQECLEIESPPRATELATKLGMRPDELSSHFIRSVGLRPSAYLKARQVENAQALLRSTTLPMNTIAYATGFGTRTTFFRAFRRETGLSPARYRELRRRIASTREPTTADRS